MYEGCGRTYPGEVEGANIINPPAAPAYLIYPDFETAPHPALQRCVRLSLRTRALDCYDYNESANPPILHRKETFLHPANPLHAKFARLTQQEEAAGLLADPAHIGTRTAWLTRLQEKGLTLRGHRLVRAPGGPETGLLRIE
jgi:DNA phosphorothioation-associated putative methyltransferase